MTNKKPTTAKNDASADLNEIKQLLVQIMKYVRFMAECEAMKHGVELHDS